MNHKLTENLENQKPEEMHRPILASGAENTFVFL